MRGSAYLLGAALLVGGGLRAQAPEALPEDLLPAEAADPGALWADEAEHRAGACDPPLDLNRARREALEATGLWTPAQVEAFLGHRERWGPLASVHELQAIPGFAAPELRAAARCFRVAPSAGDDAPWYRLAFGGSHEVVLHTGLTAERARAWSGPDSLRPYAGDRLRARLRYRYRFGRRVDYGWTAEKDPGEPWWVPGSAPGPTGPDHVSAWLALRDTGPFRDLLAGDYGYRFGQGLVWWNGFAVGKGAQAVATARTGRPFRAHTALDENRHLRGMALRWGPGDWTLSAFVSRKGLDATADGAGGVRSLPEDGLHRTPTEAERRAALGETALGLALERESARGQYGLQLSGLRYDRTLRAEPRLDNGPAWSGRQLGHASVHYRWRLGTWHLFGEAAVTDRGAPALVQGLQVSLHPNLDLSVVARHYDTAFHAPYGQGFAEGSEAANERGLYAGLAWRQGRRWSVSAFVDAYAHPWLRFTADAPSGGRDGLLEARWTPRRDAVLGLRLRAERKTGNTDAGIGTIVHRSARLHLTWPLSDAWRWQSRLEWVAHAEAGGAPSRGSALYQDLRFAPLGSDWRWSLRAMVFDTDGYDSRVFAYENQVLMAYAMPFFQGRGLRAYVLGRWRANAWLDLHARYAVTRYADRSTVGDGPETIDGPRRGEVQLTLRGRF